MSPVHSRLPELRLVGSQGHVVAVGRGVAISPSPLRAAVVRLDQENAHSELLAPNQGTTERDLVGVVEVSADGETGRQTRHGNAERLQ